MSQRMEKLLLATIFLFAHFSVVASLKCYEYGHKKEEKPDFSSLFAMPKPIQCPKDKPVCYFSSESAPFNASDPWGILNVNLRMGCETTATCKGVKNNDCRHDKKGSLCCCNSDLCNTPEENKALKGKRKCPGSDCLKGEDYCLRLEMTQITKSATVNSTGHASASACTTLVQCEMMAGGGNKCRTADDEAKTKICCCDTDNCGAKPGVPTPTGS